MSLRIFETAENCKSWMKFPLVNGNIKLKIRAASNAKISFSPTPTDKEIMVHISIGHNDNQLTSIRYDSKPPKIVEVETPDILNELEYRQFMIVWINGEVKLYQEENNDHIISLKYKFYPFYYIGTYIQDGNGTFFFEDHQNVESKNLTTYIYHGIRCGNIQFAFKGKSDARIAIMLSGSLVDPMCEIAIGEQRNTLTTIRSNNHKEPNVINETPNIVNEEHFTKFYINWENGSIWVRKDSPDGDLIITDNLCVDFVPQFFSVRTGYGAKGKWIFNVNDLKRI